MKFLNFFKNKPLSFYLCLGACVIGLINTITYAAYSLSIVDKFGGNHFDAVVFSMLLLGTLSCALPIIKPEWQFGLLAPAIFFSAAFGYYVNDRLIMFEEMINRIYGMMESGAVLGMVILIFVLNMVSFLAVAVAAFTDSDKNLFAHKS